MPAFDVLFLCENSEGNMQELSSFFEISKGITALIGGGGKTSSMYALAVELRKKGSVIVCTSTHILLPPQYPFLPRLLSSLSFGDVVSTGTVDGQKLSAPTQPFRELLGYADYVLVEADGSRQLPLKAHAPHEPVIPDEAKTVLVVIGIDGLGKPIRDAAHRPPYGRSGRYRGKLQLPERGNRHRIRLLGSVPGRAGEHHALGGGRPGGIAVGLPEHAEERHERGFLLGPHGLRIRASVSRCTFVNLTTNCRRN